MMRACLAAAALAGLAMAPAWAYPQKEADLLLTISLAAATAGGKNRQGAEAYCRQAKSTITTARSEAYLFAYVERCFGVVEDSLGDRKAACRRFGKALAIWERTPPPDDHPQSVASRVQTSKGMARYRLEHCPPKQP